jgi:hypothetical protein
MPSFGILRALAQRSLIMIRGDGDPNTAMASKPSAEWARHLGASPLKRMAASWSGSDMDPTEYRLRRERRSVRSRGARIFTIFLALLGDRPRDLEVAQAPTVFSHRCAGRPARSRRCKIPWASG